MNPSQPPNPAQKYMVGPQGPSQPYGSQPSPYNSQPPPAPYGSQPPYASQPGAQPPYGQPQPGAQPPFGQPQPGAQPPYGQPQPGAQPPYGSQQPPYGSQQPPYGSQQPPYGAQPGAQPPYGAQPGAQPPYGAQPGAQPPYGSQPGAQPPYGSQPPSQPPYGAQPPYGSQAPPPGQYGAPPQPPYGSQPGGAQPPYASQPGAPAPYGQAPMGQPPMANLQRPGTYAASPVSMNPPLARISLVKGQNVSLTKAAPNLRRARVGLGWDVRQTWGAPFDLDASVFLLNAQSLVANPMSFIFYNNKQSYDGSITHYGDNLTGAGEGDDEQVSVDLTRVPPDIHRIVFVCSIYEAEIRHQNFGMVQHAFIRIVDQDTLQEIVRFDLTEEASMWNCILFGELYRYGPEWKFKALGQGIQGGLKAAGAQFGMQLA